MHTRPRLKGQPQPRNRPLNLIPYHIYPHKGGTGNASRTHSENVSTVWFLNYSVIILVRTKTTRYIIISGESGTSSPIAVWRRVQSMPFYKRVHEREAIVRDKGQAIGVRPHKVSHVLQTGIAFPNAYRPWWKKLKLSLPEVPFHAVSYTHLTLPTKA